MAIQKDKMSSLFQRLDQPDQRTRNLEIEELFPNSWRLPSQPYLPKLKGPQMSERVNSNQPSLIMEENRFIREIGVISSVMNTLMKKYEETKIESFKEIDYIIIIDPSEPPLYRSKPKKKTALN